MIRLTAVIELDGHAPRAITHESNARAIVLGRDSSADFQLPLSTVSRRHARIVELDNVYFLEDLGSTHGTAINGIKVDSGEKKMIRDGDVIEVTRAKITCSIQTEKVALAEPGEGTQAIAARAVQGILGRLGEAQGEGPYFRVLNGADEGTRFPVAGSMTEWSFGRSKDCEFVLNDPNVSRRHALVKKDWNGFTIQDLGSKNGVIVNSRHIEKPKRLKDKDELTIGPVKLIYIDPDAELLAALKDVPGFDMDEDGESDVHAELSMGQPDEDGADRASDDGPDALPAEMGTGGDINGDAADGDMDDELSHIDPELLEAPQSRAPFESVIVGFVSIVVLAAAGLLVVILS